MSRSSPAIFERGALTDWLLDQLGVALRGLVYVGDGVAPKEGGWLGGMPGQGSFTPYVVLTTGEATIASPAPLAQAVGDDWTCQYQLRAVGGVRQQADWAADQVRRGWIELGHPVLDLGSHWKLYRADIAKMGAVARNDQTDPPYWELVDALSVNVSRERT